MAVHPGSWRERRLAVVRVVKSSTISQYKTSLLKLCKWADVIPTSLGNVIQNGMPSSRVTLIVFAVAVTKLQPAVR